MTGISKREQFAHQLRLGGWIGFGWELVLGVISLLILAIAIFDPNFNLNLKSGLGLFTICLGLIGLGLSIYWMFYYIQLSRRLNAADPEIHPHPSAVSRTLHQGITIHFAGILLTLLAAQIIIGSLLIKVLTIPSGTVIYESRQLIEPLDILVVQSSLFMIAAECVGLFITYWLIKQMQGKTL